MLPEEKEYQSEIEAIKQDIVLTRNIVLRNANHELIEMYFRIGRSISENSFYGSGFIKMLSKVLKQDFPDATGYSERNLSRMKKFYEEYRELSNLPMALANLPWSFNCLLVDKIKDIDKRIWYAEKCIENGWSYVVMDHQIDLQLYERQADNSKKLSNYSEKLPLIQGELAQDMLKDPYVFELAGLKEKIVEKDIENAMLEKIKSVLLELGKGFSFVGNQYKISTENKDYFIDLLFYHLELRCYVVVELKNVDFDPSYVGQLQFYVTAVDEIVKKDMDNPTIGLLLCKGKDRLSVEWALKPANAPIGVASYEVKQYLPSDEELNNLLTDEQ
ncbi:MAG: PDDEXK nuclease domain-containing protein [Bacilli bacterium]|nr:PDDEXK nuclease domain-containing protein [Bacilli bacterium]